jgi:FKBP-type peptidyl-prolyl cis-trans isomerase FkpA
MKNFILLFFVSFTLIRCSGDSGNDVQISEPQDNTDIIAYLEDNNISAIKTTGGLYYLIEEEGTGENPTASSNVTVAYKGYLLNGTIFDQSSSEGISFGLNQVIPGWTIGIPLFKTGGKGKLFIPPTLGYGNRLIGSIPPGSVLVFDVHLISIN